MINQILDALKLKLQAITTIKEFTYIHKDPLQTPQCVLVFDKWNEQWYETGRTIVNNDFNIFLKIPFENLEADVTFFNSLIDSVVAQIWSNKTLNGLVENIMITSITSDSNEDATKVRSVVISLSTFYKLPIAR